MWQLFVTEDWSLVRGGHNENKVDENDFPTQAPCNIALEVGRS